MIVDQLGGASIRTWEDFPSGARASVSDSDSVSDSVSARVSDSVSASVQRQRSVGFTGQLG